jgi:hypothetical protein
MSVSQEDMWNNRLLHIVPIVLMMQIVAGVLFFGMTLGPWKQSLMSSSFTSQALRVTK